MLYFCISVMPLEFSMFSMLAMRSSLMAAYSSDESRALSRRLRSASIGLFPLCEQDMHNGSSRLPQRYSLFRFMFAVRI